MRNKLSVSFVLATALLCLAAESWAVTTRTAKVYVKNDTGRKLAAVVVNHKYSDNFKEQLKTTGYLEVGKQQEVGSVQFNTGAGTTGRDWWLVAFVDAEGNAFTTAPENLRDAVDFFEKIDYTIAKYIVDSNDTPEKRMFTGMTTVITGGYASLAAKAVIAATLPLVNAESTVGFKQHIIREGDNVIVRLRIDEASFISIKGQSDITNGQSDTGVKAVVRTSLWNSGTQNNPGATLKMQDDGNLVIYSKVGKALWSSGTQNNPGATLKMQDDGNLVIYSKDGKALWKSGTQGHRGATLVMQGDGNLVIYKF